MAAPCLKEPFGVPFRLRRPAAVGVSISDSSLRRLVSDAWPSQYRRVWENNVTPGANGRVEHRTIWVTALGGCAMVGEATSNGYSTLEPFIRHWIGYLGPMEFFAAPIQDCV